MAFAKKLFFIALFISLLMEGGSSSSDPWAGFAWFFHADIQSWLPQSHIPLNPFEIIFLIILIAWALRGRRDRRFHFERGLLFWPITVFSSLLLVSWVWGTVQSGSNPTVGLQEIRALEYAALAYFLVGIIFTHRRDLNTLTWVILTAAATLGLEDIIRYLFFIPGRSVGDLDYDHSDSIVLSSALILSLAMLLLGSTRKQKYFVLAMLPIDLVSMMVIHRRAAFATLVIGLVFFAVILLRVNRPLFLKIVPVTVLILSIYVGAEWNCNSGSALCQPARAISSQFNPDPRDASSDAYRATERYDLILNIQNNLITGRGFGQQFIFYEPLPDLSFWVYWHYTPHDEILWVWVKMGAIGFLAFWWLIATALYRSGRLTQALSAAGDNNARALLAAAACLIVMQMTVSYVDLGLTDDRSMLLLGVMFGVIGHLPGILRRSTSTDEPPSPAQRLRDRGTNALERETPEVQATVLAQVLVSPVESADASRRNSSHPRQNTRNGWESRWNPGNNAPTRSSSSSQSPSSISRPRNSRPLTNSRRPVAPMPSDSLLDELPWTRKSREP